MDGEDITLPEHEAKSEHRAHKLGEKIHELKEEIMSTDNTAAILAAMGNRGVDGAGMGLGAGLGGGLLGGILGGALLGNRGLLGTGAAVAAEVGAGVVTPAMLTSGLASVIDSNQNTTLLQSVGDVKAAVPLAEAQVQLAIAGSTATLTSGQAMINKNISEAIAASLASQNNINVNVLNQGSQTRELVNAIGQANLTATKDAQFATQVAVSNSTKEILAALNDQNTANLQRQLTVAEASLLENRLVGRQREVEVNVTQTVAQNQAQAQAQQQQQQQAIILAQLCSAIQGLQVATATNSNLIVGNTGATTTGPQAANPVNVRA